MPKSKVRLKRRRLVGVAKRMPGDPISLLCRCGALRCPRCSEHVCPSCFDHLEQVGDQLVHPEPRPQRAATEVRSESAREV